MLALVVTAVPWQRELQNVQVIQATSGAFAAVLGDGSVVTWGDAGLGADSAAVRDQLKNVQQIASTPGSFAAVLGDGTVVVWGNVGGVGDSSAVQAHLKPKHLAFGLQRYSISCLQEHSCTKCEQVLLFLRILYHTCTVVS